MNRRRFVQLSSAVLVGACAGPQSCDSGGGPGVPEPTGGPGPVTFPPPGVGGFDGNVVRETTFVGGFPVTVAWRRPQGDAELLLVGGVLELRTARYGRHTFTGFGDDEFRSILATTMGASVYEEALQSLRRLAG